MTHSRIPSDRSAWTDDQVDQLLTSYFSTGPLNTAADAAQQPRRRPRVVWAVVACAVALSIAAGPLFVPRDDDVGTERLARWVGDLPEASESVDLAATEISSEEELPGEEAASDLPSAAEADPVDSDPAETEST
jgi:hypothetical protein